MQADYEYFAAAAQARSDVALSERPTNPAHGQPCALGPAPLLRLSVGGLGWAQLLLATLSQLPSGPRLWMAPPLFPGPLLPTAADFKAPTADCCLNDCRVSRAAGCPGAEVP